MLVVVVEPSKLKYLLPPSPRPGLALLAVAPSAVVLSQRRPVLLPQPPDFPRRNSAGTSGGGLHLGFVVVVVLVDAAG